jgi:pSer/pThr/pTyr-binding forkhead associated (FHA) protein
VASLQVKSGPLAGQRIDVTGELVIGRADADITIDDADLSRRHAAVRQASGALEVEDLGSTNGTFVDGDRIDGPTRVGGGTEIRLGATVLEVEGVIPLQPMQASAAADRQETIVRRVPDEMTRIAPTEPAPAAQAPASAPPAPPPVGPGRPATTSVPVGEFHPPTRRRGRGLASRSWVPVVLSFGTVVLTAVALVIYFAAR